MKHFRDLLNENRKFMGTILQFPCPEIVEILKEAGSDYIIIDNEHSFATTAQTVAMLRAAQSVDLPAMVRVPKIDEDVIKKVLDMGFDAIAARIYRFDEVTAVYLMSGAYDLMLEVQAESLRTLANFVSQKLATIDSVLSTATHFVLKKYKVDGVILEEEHADHRLAVTP